MGQIEVSYGYRHAAYEISVIDTKGSHAGKRQNSSQRAPVKSIFCRQDAETKELGMSMTELARRLGLAQK